MDKPWGVVKSESYNRGKVNVKVLGVSHNEVDSCKLARYIQKLSFNPTVVCLESPSQEIVNSEHKGAQIYCDTNNVKLSFIDVLYQNSHRKAREYTIRVSNSIDVDEFSMGHYQRDEGYRKRTKNKVLSDNPKFAQNMKMRNNMMAREILNEINKKNQKIISIVGSLHVDGIIRSIETLESKYGS